MAMEIRGFPLLLTIWLLLQVLASHSLAIRTEPLVPSGLAKDAWPELSGKDGVEALKEIKRVVDNVFIQEPTSVEDLPEVIGGNADDVWIYTDGSGVVVGIPQRAPWHPNRLRPGWTELKGVDYKEAIQKILKEATGVKVLFGPEGMVVSSDFDLGRVIVFVDPSGKVAQVPHLG